MNNWLKSTNNVQKNKKTRIYSNNNNQIHHVKLHKQKLKKYILKHK